MGERCSRELFETDGTSDMDWIRRMSHEISQMSLLRPETSFRGLEMLPNGDDETRLTWDSECSKHSRILRDHWKSGFKTRNDGIRRPQVSWQQVVHRHLGLLEVGMAWQQDEGKSETFGSS